MPKIYDNLVTNTETELWSIKKQPRAWTIHPVLYAQWGLSKNPKILVFSVKKGSF